MELESHRILATAACSLVSVAGCIRQHLCCGAHVVGLLGVHWCCGGRVVGLLEVHTRGHNNHKALQLIN